MSSGKKNQSELDERLAFAKAIWVEISDESAYIMKCAPKLTLSNFQALKRHSIKLCKLILEYDGVYKDIEASLE